MNRAQLIADLTRDEGLRLKPYKDTVGKTTIGIGRNLDDVGITKAEAEYLLENDIDKVAAQLTARLPWWQGLDEPRQRAVANMAFNLGIDGLLKFTATLAALRAGDNKAAAYHALNSKWAEQVGARAQRIAKLMEG